jgi:hypothetical protein
MWQKFAKFKGAEYFRKALYIHFNYIQNWLYYRQTYSSVSLAVRVAGPRWSRRWRSWMWRFWPDVVTPGLWLWGWLDVLTNSLKWHWRWLMVEKWTFLQSACQLRAPWTWDVALCCVTKLHILVAFIFPCTCFTCVMIMVFNQLFDMSHLSGGWIILAKEKCSLTGM